MTLSACSAGSDPVYKDASAPVEKRVEDLLGRMTLEEKVGQMNQFVGIEHIKTNESSLTEEELKNNTAQAFYPGFPAKEVERMTREGLIGSFLHVLTLDEANYLQSLALQSRLSIPIIFGIDAIHGNANAPDNTVYPTNIGLACTFDLDLAYRIARETAAEMRAMNMHWTFNPNVEVARDPRWGRVGETFGEDPYLVALMGAETVRGYQGDLSSDDVLACIKHFVGGSQPINGTKGSLTRKFLQFISLSVMSRSTPSSRIFTTSLKSTCATGFQTWSPIRHSITVSIGWPVLFRNCPRSY